MKIFRKIKKRWQLISFHRPAALNIKRRPSAAGLKVCVVISAGCPIEVAKLSALHLLKEELEPYIKWKVKEKLIGNVHEKYLEGTIYVTHRHNN